MRNLSQLAMLVLCFVAMGCRDADEPEASVAEVAEAGACKPLNACGGDLEGIWEITDGCYSFMTVSGGPVIPSCPAATIEYVPDAAGGTYTFQNNGRYRAQFEVVGRMVMTVPTSCLGSRASCADLEDVAAGRSCVLTASRTCHCTEHFEQSTDQEGTGDYVVQGSRVDFSNDVSMTYCAQTDRLTLETVSMVEMGDTVDGQLRFVLERR